MGYTNYTNFVISLRSMGATGITVEVTSSPVGELPSVDVALPGSLDRFVADADLPVDDTDTRLFGEDLFGCLFPPRVRALYRAALASLAAQSGLRLLVQTDSATLAAIPWEYSYDAETRAWPALDPRTPLVRYYALPFSRSAVERKQSLRVLAVLAAPSNLPGLDLDSERRHLEALFLPLQQAGRLELHTIESPATVERLQNTLRQGYDVLHYVGHGTQQSGQGALLLERDDGKSQQVLAGEVAILLRRTGIRLVCLNACLTGAERGSLFGGLGPALVQAEIPAVVAMQYPMPDQSALRFTRAFYGAVADGEPIDAAITAARIALRTQLGPGSPEWGFPVLYMRAADGRLWPDPPGDLSKPIAACPRCGRTVAAEARFCASCGAALACPSCGSRVRAEARFCPLCRAALRPQASSPPGGVQISDNAKVNGIVIGGDAVINQPGGNMVFGESRGAPPGSGPHGYPQNHRRGSDAA